MIHEDDDFIVTCKDEAISCGTRKLPSERKLAIGGEGFRQERVSIVLTPLVRAKGETLPEAATFSASSIDDTLPSAPTPAEERETEDQQVSLKTPIPFRYPAGTKTLPFEHMSKSLQRRYVKVKEPLFDPVTSKRIYWREEPFDVNGKDDDHGHDHGCLFFLKVSIRGMVDKWFGPLLGLPKTEDFNY
ncbi:hypothetical protein IGI04_026965 [Brassica rapa subsp. trilocularis]|uniref:Uncharacterized protein n=1 Tax=Brassica rapa subsp. trilocularis TaxID=1813537 RepID=A0ABQ7L1C3_BRACM|nr:hypothetical protein IGI04_026965 [Brassica rapa subsp. trilocularis]